MILSMFFTQTSPFFRINLSSEPLTTARKSDIIKEALNKSWHASCLHIFRHFARKLLEIHQVFLRHFHTILGAASAWRKICLRNLHTRFNQYFLKNNHKKAVKRNSTRRMRRRERAVGESPAQRSANPSLSCGAQQVLPNYAPSDAPVKELWVRIIPNSGGNTDYRG